MKTYTIIFKDRGTSPYTIDSYQIAVNDDITPFVGGDANSGPLVIFGSQALFRLSEIAGYVYSGPLKTDKDK